MKKSLASFVFLSLASIQLLAGTSPSSQFSLHARQIAAQAATEPSATAKMHSARMHAFTAATSPLNPVGFLTATQLPASGLAQWSAVAADFNNDGKMDFAAPVETAPGVFGIAVMINTGGGSFQESIIDNPNGVDGDQILVGDVNNDGNQDIIVVHSTAPSTFEVWLGEGNGNFTVGTHFRNSIGPNYPLAGVLTNSKANGYPGLLFIDTQSPAHVWTITNNTGTFGPTNPPVTLSGGALSDVVFADFNGDGILDFAANDLSLSGQTAIFTGQSNGTFVEGSPLTNPNQSGGICNNAAGVLNNAGNGNYDLVSVNCGSGGVAPGSITVYVNSGTGTFPTGVVYYPATELTDNTEVSVGPLAVTIADVNGDGKNDIVSSNNYGGDVTVLLGNGDGTLKVPDVGYSTGGSPSTSALVADFNGDGFADIIVPDKEFSFVYLQGYGDGTFRAPMDYYSPVPDNLFGDAEVIATGDFNNDGYPDFVVGNCCDHEMGVTVFLSNPDGSLSKGTNYGVSGDFASVVVADFDQDGDLDFAAYDYSNNTIEIFKGHGDGTFTGIGTYSTGGSNGTSGVNFNRMVTGLFNGDKYPDLAVVSYNSQNVSVLLNDGLGDGAFLTATTYADNGSGSAIALADVNNDGNLDLIVPQGNQGVDVFLGNGDGTFQTVKTSPFNFNKLGNLAIGDLNGDGKLDIAVAVADTTTPHVGLAVAEGDGLGDFGTPILFGITTQNTALSLPVPGDVKMFDLKGDLVYTNLTYGTVGILYNTGATTFGAGLFNSPVEYPAGSLSYSLALADVNHDGATDIVTSNNNYAGVTVLLNASGNSNALVSSANPSTATESVALTATVAATVRGVTAVPTGTVTFMDGSTSLGAAALNSGVATVNAAALAVGTHNITAQYSGDANFGATTSTALSQLVILATDATALGSSLNPAGTGQSVTLSATVSPSSNGVTAKPTGNVTFSDGSTVLGSAAVTNGMARFVTSSLAVGPHSIKAQYAGDTNFAASTSATFSQSVVAPAFALGAKTLTSTVNAGASAEYTISVTPSYGYTANVSFSCPASLPSKVTCSFSPASLAASNGSYPTTTLTLTTTAASTASLTPPVLPNSKPTDPMLLASLGGFGLFGLVFVGAAGSKRNRSHMAILGVALLITMFALVGCGGSSSSNNNNQNTPGTPAGQYTVPVTATGTGAPTQTMNVTLIVQ